MRTRLALAILGMAMSCLVHCQQPQEYMGARAVLAQMRVPPRGSALADPVVVLAGDILSFGNRVAKMPPEEAATQWLALVGRCFAVADTGENTPNLFPTVLEALPSPDSWPLVVQRLGSEPGIGPTRVVGLRALMSLLQSRDADAWSLLGSLPLGPSDALDPWLDQAKFALASRRRDADAVEALLLARVEGMKDFPQFENRSGPIFEVPDLVELFGEARARTLLTRFLLTVKAELVFGGNFRYVGANPGSATEKLAREIAIDQAEQLAWPQWTLASSMDSESLFEIFRKRFPKQKLGMSFSNPSFWSTYNGAALYRLAGLFLAGDRDRVRTFAEAYTDDLIVGWGIGIEPIQTRLLEAEKTGEFLDFLERLALEHPETGFLGCYSTFARDHRSLAQSERFWKQILASPKAPESVKESARSQLQDVYLREGKLPEVASLLLQAPSSDYPYFSDETARLMIVLGGQLNRPDLLKRGFDLAIKSVSEDPEIRDWKVGDALIRAGHGPRLESSMIDALAAEATGHEGGRRAALGLLALYGHLGRHRDVVTLLERFPAWGFPDLVALSGGDLLLTAATALAKVGRTAEALRILRYDIRLQPQNDQEYALLVDHFPDQAAEILDGLAREFPALSRPLMWKATLLLRGHKLAEAESAARQAIALDPNDIDAWAEPTRFKAYSVLAEIERAKGDSREAERLAVYAQCALLASRAAGYEEDNLFLPAIHDYKRVLALAPDDFRTRLQLGIDLIKIGHEADGIWQVQTACRQVPKRFGTREALPPDLRISPTALSAARAVLQAQVDSGATNGGVYVLLGEIDGSVASVSNFLRASQLDPDDPLAWRGLSWYVENMSSESSRRVRLNVLRLDSAAAFSLRVMGTGNGRDYRQAWLDAADAAKRRLEVSDSIFELRASRARLATSSDQNFIWNSQGREWERGFGPPAEGITDDPLIDSLSRLIAYSKG